MKYWRWIVWAAIWLLVGILTYSFGIWPLFAFLVISDFLKNIHEVLKEKLKGRQ